MSQVEGDAGAEQHDSVKADSLLVHEGEPTFDPDAPIEDIPPDEGGPANDGSTGPDPEQAVDDDDEPGTRGGMKLSRKGAKFIGRFEGYVAKPYNDPVGHCTIGYGHLLHLGACTGSDFSRFSEGLDPDQALQFLRRDAREAARAVRGLGITFTQPQYDAILSFTFNLGGGWTSGSGLQRALVAGDYAAVPRELSRWVYAGSPPRVLQGLVNRRRAEGRLYSQGLY